MNGHSNRATGERAYLTVCWCFFHTRREWSDMACPEPARWTLPDGTAVWQLLQAA